MHRRNTMTIEIHQDEIILTSEFTNKSPKRINLTRSSRNKIFLFSIYFLESFFCVTLYIFTTYRRNQFFNYVLQYNAPHAGV